MSEIVNGKVVSGKNDSLVSITKVLEDTEQISHTRRQSEGMISNLGVLVKSSIEDVQVKVRMVTSEAELLTIKTDDDLINANQFLVDLAPCIKKATEYKDSLTKTIKQNVKIIDDLFKNIITPLTNTSELIRNKTVRFRREQQEAAAEVARILEEARIAEENKRKEEAALNNLPYTPPEPKPEITPPAITEQKTLRVDNGQVTYTPTWEFQITDIDKVPEEVLRAACCTSRGREALESIIRLRVKGGTRVMDGVKIYPSEQTTVRK